MKKVFISYVRENMEIVDQLCQELRSHGIEVWLDRNDIALGSRWKREIRRAIQQGAFFMECFSQEYHERDRTYMNEELTIAIEELRQRPIDSAWFIPVKLNQCEIPDLLGLLVEGIGIQSNMPYPLWKLLEALRYQEH